jgi:DnaJ like chaperone protein
MGEAAESGAGAVGALLAWTGGLFAGIGDPALRRQVAFSVALIALAAKMAKADGVVTQSEIAAFRRMFSMPASEEANVTRLFDLAKRDVAGYDSYAARVAVLYQDNPDTLVDVLDGLFFIAGADGAVHEAELVYLEDVARIFGIAGAAFERIVARHAAGAEGDPYLVLGVDRSWPFGEIRARYRKLVAENHPDVMIGRGMPEELIAIANDRLAAINRAWKQVENEQRVRS